MAANALRKRDYAASKLRDSTRQLRRYLDGDAHTERILVAKSDKVSVDREELEARNNDYAEKAGIAVDAEEITEYMEPLVDGAVDIVDEATVRIEELTTASDAQLETTRQAAITERKRVEIASAKYHAESYKTMVEGIVAEINLVLATEEPDTEDSIKVSTFLNELDNKEEELIKSWNDYKEKLTDETEIQAAVIAETAVRTEVSTCRRNAKVLVAKVKQEDPAESTTISDPPTSASSSSSSSVKLPRVKPPVFSGDIRDFASFRSDFERIVQNEYNKDPVYHVYIMKESCLTGEAKSLVRNLQSLEEIWERLTEKYGDTMLIVDTVLDDLRGVTIAKFRQDEGVIKLIETLEKGVQDLTRIGKRKDIANPYTVQLLERKLPRPVLRKWFEEDEVSESEEKFEALFEYLKKERKRTEKMLQQTREKEKEEKLRREREESRGRDRQRNRQPVNHQTGGESQPSNQKCLIHPNAPHFTRKCEAFRRKSVEERGQLVKDLSACKLCLTTSHVGQPCPRADSWQACGVDNCAEMHSRLLHGATVLPQLNMHILQVSAAAKELDSEARTLLLMQDIPSAKGGSVFTFWDNGSGISLVSKQYARRHCLKGIPISYDLMTVNNVITPQRTMLYDVTLKDRNGDINTILAYGIDEICEETAFFDANVAEIFPNVKANEVKRPRRRVDLLVGMNYIKLHPQVSETVGDLALFVSQFGSGKLLGGQHSCIRGSDKTNAFAKLVAYGGMRNITVERPDKVIDFFESERLGVTVPPRCDRCGNCKECKFEVTQLSMREQRELKVIKDGLTLNPETQKWTASYPYKIDPSVLKDNREQALSILIRLENRLKRDKVASDSYCKQFEDFIERGVFRELSSEEMSNYKGPVNYISHHEVYKEGSVSTPVRIVSNSSLQFQGHSFNSCLMTGPNVLTCLLSIQLRFRVHLVALVGDISKMYHSVLTTEKEAHLRRVLWRGMNLDEEPKTYVTMTVAFGDRPAPAITTVAIRETAELYKHINEKAAEVIKEDMYVDDEATGDETREKVVILKDAITEILAKGSFRIKDWVMSGDSTEEARALLGSGDIGRVLGIYWDPTEDVFVVRVRVNLSKKHKGKRQSPDLTREEIPSMITMKLSRRMVLAVTQSIYDIYGFIVPLTIQLKIIIRELHKKELCLRWDDDIPASVKQKFIDTLMMAKEAEDLKFPRCISRKDSVGNPMLIVFNDGSQVAMCAAAYIRWQLLSGECTSQLVAAKARVTPLERMTIPRSEMQSAVLGVRLSKTVRTAVKLQFEKVIHIADSECTIATIAKESTALNEFMGNRVVEINATTEPSQWLRVKSEDNIADLGTRANATIEDMRADSEWHRCKQYVNLPLSEWPTHEVGPEHVPKEELAKQKMCASLIAVPPLIDLTKWRMRTHTLLMQSTARVIASIEQKSFKTSVVTPSALEKAENYWIEQSMVYTKEALEKGHLKSLCPKVDERGHIVLSSRAQKGLKLNYNRDRFPILTTRDPFAFIWMKHCHDEDHSGRTKTVAKSRKKFWIVRAGRLYEKVRSQCYRCRLLDKELAMQQMSPLPECRLTVAPVFHTTSIDLFGPLTIKDTVKKRVTMKVWGFIANCAATRAIHVDLTDSYSTDSILQTIRKFVATRGCPAEFISDQGSQMKAAANDLTKDWDWSVVSSWSNSSKIKWTVVPAEGQHQNGLSESLVKSVKRSIKHVIGENVLTFSELQLAFYEIANIINSRPVGVVPGSDADDPTPITPNDLMLGRSSNEVPQGPFDTNASKTKRFRFIQSVVDDWWRKWSDLVLPSLVPSYKWQQKHRNVKLGDICLIRYKNTLRSTYRLGRVSEVKTSEDGLVRSVRLQYKLPTEKVHRSVDRPIHGIVVIVPFEEQ